MQTLMVIGGGNMARAIITGVGDSDTLDLDRIVVVEPDAERRAHFARSTPDVRTGLDLMRTLEHTPERGRILLAVKPQKLNEVGSELRPLIMDESRCVISILAGMTIARIAQALGEHHRIVRTMPNTPAQIARGMSAIAPGPHATRDDIGFSRSLFGCIGEIIEIEESLMDAFTAIAGSGPAYAFLLAEAMATAAMEMGFDQTQSRLIVSETMAGAGLLLAREPRDPEALRRAVTSPGGTTAAALSIMQDANLSKIIVRALHAARNRGEELSRA